MEVEFGGQLQQRSVPDRLRLVIATGGERLPRPTAVLEATRQEVARDGLLVGEREVPNLTPIDLQVFARQALKTNRHVGDGLFAQTTQPFPADRRPPHRTAAKVGMVGVLARELHHANAAESLLQPLRNLLPERIDARLPPPT